MDIDALFGDMAKAPVYGRGNQAAVGDYLVEIKAMKVKASEKKKGQVNFICEYDIIQVFSTKDPEKMRPGVSGAWIGNFTQAPLFGNIKELMFAILGKKGSAVPESDVSAHRLVTLMATSACDGPRTSRATADLRTEFGIDDVNAIVKGARVLLSTVDIELKDKSEFTRHTWSPTPEAAAAAQAGA